MQLYCPATALKAFSTEKPEFLFNSLLASILAMAKSFSASSILLASLCTTWATGFLSSLEPRLKQDYLECSLAAGKKTLENSAKVKWPFWSESNSVIISHTTFSEIFLIKLSNMYCWSSSSPISLSFSSSIKLNKAWGLKSWHSASSHLNLSMFDSCWATTWNKSAMILLIGRKSLLVPVILLLLDFLEERGEVVPCAGILVSVYAWITSGAMVSGYIGKVCAILGFGVFSMEYSNWLKRCGVFF